MAGHIVSYRSLKSLWQAVLMYTAGQVDWACSRGGLRSPGILSVVCQQQFFLHDRWKELSWDPQGNKCHQYYLLMTDKPTGWLQGSEKNVNSSLPLEQVTFAFLMI